MLARIKDKGDVSYQRFTDAAELQLLDENDLAVLLSERFSLTQTQGGGTPGDAVDDLEDITEQASQILL
jgi:hypothetical protein